MSDPVKCCDCGSTITPTEDGEYPEGRRVSVTFNMHVVAGPAVAANFRLSCRFRGSCGDGLGWSAG